MANIPLLVKGAQFAVSNWRKIVTFFIGVLVGFIFLGYLAFNVINTNMRVSPSLSQSLAVEYSMAVEGTGLDYSNLVHLDTVRYKNDFSDVDIEETAWLFPVITYQKWTSSLKSKTDRYQGETVTDYYWGDFVSGPISQVDSPSRAIKMFKNIAKRTEYAYSGLGFSTVIKGLRELSGVEYEYSADKIVYYDFFITYKTVYEVAEELEIDDDFIEWLSMLDTNYVIQNMYGPLDGTILVDLPDHIDIDLSQIVGTFAFPAPNYVSVSSHFGWRIHPILKTRKLHKGTDFPTPIGTPIIAPYDGKVSKVANQPEGAGLYVKILHNVEGVTVETKFFHLSRQLVHVGQEVKMGDVIGASGNTGGSTGPHLHFETHVRATNGFQPVDAMKFLH